MPELPNRWLQMLHTCNSILSDAVHQLYNEVDGVFTAGHGKAILSEDLDSCPACGVGGGAKLKGRPLGLGEGRCIGEEHWSGQR